MSEKIHLRYDLLAAGDEGVTGHAHDVMRKLGIVYRLAVAQSIAAQWWFFDCENVPDPLPLYLYRLDIEPRDALGNGLSAEDVAMLEKGRTK